jgi:transcriptional regulator with XRE-family HTH domain
MLKRYHMDLKTVGKRLREAREELQLTMEQMRDISGYSKSLISASENGFKKPSTIYLFVLYDKFNINIHYIFSGRGNLFVAPADEARDKNQSTVTTVQDTEHESTLPGGAKVPFYESDENARQMFYLMEKVDMVRFAILSYFIHYRTQNKQIIDSLLEEKRSLK